MLLFGYRPNTNEAWFAELAPATDALGYLVVDGNMETSCHGAFAAGDDRQGGIGNAGSAQIGGGAFGFGAVVEDRRDEIIVHQIALLEGNCPALVS